MKHFLAYGNSDQFSFRNDSVRESFDFMSVPGTIAAYYADATAAFVLSSDLEYVIDPRTPLYQEALPHPRASHYALAEWLGPAVRRHLGDEGGRTFPATFYTPSVIEEMVASVIGHQQQYATRGTAIQPKLDRYARLLAEARGLPAEAAPVGNAGRAPSFMLAPYFALRGFADPWWQVNLGIWSAIPRSDRRAVSAALCLANVGLLADALASVPTDLASTTFFWVAGFDERTASVEALTAMWEAIASSDRRSLVNMYGGFFSVCLEYAGLWGFNNGLGYSEAREWPQLSATGAAPARYYLRDLHMYLSPALAQSLVTRAPSLACPCTSCEENGGDVLAMSYHDLKRHFAAARKWEIELVAGNDPAALRNHLRSAFTLGHTAASSLPERARPSLDHLTRWENALSRVT